MKILARLTVAAILTGTAFCVGPLGADTDEMLPEVRRVITLGGEGGSAVVLADGASQNSLILNGSRITRIWETQEMPVSLHIEGDKGATAGNAYRDGFVGSSLYVADIPAGSDLSDIPLHAQDSLDYIAVLEGEIDLVLPDRSIKLQSGDILVQAGNYHSWANVSDSPCRLLVVVLTGRR